MKFMIYDLKFRIWSIFTKKFNLLSKIYLKMQIEEKGKLATPLTTTSRIVKQVYDQVHQAYDGRYDVSALVGPEETGLGVTVSFVAADVAAKVGTNDYHGAIATLATLRAPVDAFFEAVLVNDPDPAIRANRLNLLAKLRDTMRLVADFSKVAG